MVAPEQNAERERRKRIRRDERGHVRLEKAKRVAAGQDKQNLREDELHKDRSENEEHARVLRKRARLIDPELRHRDGHE